MGKIRIPDAEIGLAWYRQKHVSLEACVVTPQLEGWLRSQGYVTVYPGDYYVKLADGTYNVMTKKHFERLFEPIKDYILIELERFIMGITDNQARERALTLLKELVE